MKLLFPTLILFLIGCGNSGTGSASSSNIPGDIPGAGGSLQTMQAGSVSFQPVSLSLTPNFQSSSTLQIPADIQGGWATQECAQIYPNVELYRRVQEAVVQNKKYRFRFYFSDSDCQSGDLIGRDVSEYELATFGTPSWNLSVTAINTKKTLEYYKAETADGANYFNIANYCNKNDWAAGDLVVCDTSNEQTKYTIFEIYSGPNGTIKKKDGVSYNEQIVPSQYDGSTEDLRHRYVEQRTDFHQSKIE